MTRFKYKISRGWREGGGDTNYIISIEERSQQPSPLLAIISPYYLVMHIEMSLVKDVHPIKLARIRSLSFSLLRHV